MCIIYIICIDVSWVRSVFISVNNNIIFVPSAAAQKFRPFDSRGMRTKELLPYNNIILYCI